MRSLLLKLALLLLASIPAWATTATVTGTVQDPTTQVIAYGTVIAVFNGSANPGVIYTTTGGANFTQVVSGLLNSSGTFSITLTTTNSMNPSGGKWNIIVCSPTGQCSGIFSTTVTGGVDFSSQLSAVMPTIVANAVQPFPSAYSDSEIVNPTYGSTYYNLISLAHRAYNGSSWSTLAGGGGSSSGNAGAVQISGGAGAFTSDANFTANTTTHQVQVGAPALNYVGAFGASITYSDTANSHRTFEDASGFNPTLNTTGWCSFCDDGSTGGTAGADHHASFQAAHIVNTGGTGVGALEAFYAAPTVNSTGIVGTFTGLYMAGATVNAGGTLTKYQAIYNSNQTSASNNYFIIDDCLACRSYISNSIAVGVQQAAFAFTNDMLSVYGHLGVGTFGAAAGNKPTMGTCGTSPAVTGSDSGGQITVGSGATTSCTLNFKSSFPTAPSCTVNLNATTITLGVAPTTTTLVITSSADMQGKVVNYHCITIAAN